MLDVTFIDGGMLTAPYPAKVTKPLMDNLVQEIVDLTVAAQKKAEEDKKGEL